MKILKTLGFFETPAGKIQNSPKFTTHLPVNFVSFLCLELLSSLSSDNSSSKAAPHSQQHYLFYSIYAWSEPQAGSEIWQFPGIWECLIIFVSLSWVHEFLGTNLYADYWQYIKALISTFYCDFKQDSQHIYCLQLTLFSIKIIEETS